MSDQHCYAVSPGCLHLQAAPEESSRGLDPAAEPAGPDGGTAEASGVPGSHKGLRGHAWSAAAALAGGLFGLDGQLPKFEEAARELVHPLFETLKAEVGVGGGGKGGADAVGGG
jgi:hypothetical protein